ncbi:nitronate monooxygenase [Exilibacterium tricleocarpae]|uniref:Nitronate monooxygenase n=1 Tax=Exilibacterium tricleocarpae TaxID=2591008 RepID=A0A545TLP0_9GAMM|nr:nitronate monooxygenase family protein [Exilibacterium tricleocarpae]TQV78142.1 nitronate monooxygenase [Exilibacterium tricleocarpae]
MAMPTALQGRLRLPVIAAPMFIVSGPELVIAECQAGVVGSFPALNARPQALLEEWITRIKTELAAFQSAHPERPVAPFAVNQIVHHSNDRLAADWDTIIAHEVPVIITSLRAPDPDVIERIHAYGGIILHDVINVRHAKKAAAAGVDGLILVCAGAGGHAGTNSPFALVSEVRAFFDGAVILSGAIANGDAVLSAQALGADLAYMGTRFIATREANADATYKEMLVQHATDDIVYTNLFTGVHGNYLKPSIEAAGLDPNDLPQSDKTKMNFGSGGNTGAKAWKDIWGAGQGLGSIEDVPAVGELVDRLENEYRAAAQRLNRTLEQQTG